MNVNARNAHTLIGLITLLLIFIVVIQLRSSQKIAYYQNALKNKTQNIAELNHNNRMSYIDSYRLDEITSDQLQQMFDEDPFNFLPLTQKILHTNYVHPNVPENFELRGVKVEYSVANHQLVQFLENNLENIGKFNEYKIIEKKDRKIEHEDPAIYQSVKYSNGANTVVLLESKSQSTCYHCVPFLEKAEIYEEIVLSNSKLSIIVRPQINIGDKKRDVANTLGLDAMNIKDDTLIRVYDPLATYKDIRIFLENGLVSEIHWNDDSVKSSLGY